MEIVIPKRLDRKFIQFANPQWIFIYSCAVHKERGFGQASVCKGLENCFGIPVRNSYCLSSGFFSDNDPNYRIEVDVALSKIPLDGRIIIPIPKIGEGASRLIEFAPKLYAHIKAELDKIKYPLIKYV